MEHIEDYYTLHREIIYEYLGTVKDSVEYVMGLKKINPIQFKTCLFEFVRYGKLMRFPERIVLRWKRIIIENTCHLDAFTDLSGHSSSFPFDELNDVYETDIRDYEQAWKLCDNEDETLFPTWTNGHYFMSDFGLKPLQEICITLMNTIDVNEIIPLISKALDVSHQRSDLCELFIRGGQNSLNYVQNDV